MKCSPKGFSIAALILLLTASIAWAQATAQLNGRVTDESGAVLPGVSVTVTQTDTAFTRTVVTDETGAWTDGEHPHRSVPIGGVAARVPHLRADRHRPAGQLQSGHQCVSRPGEPGGDGDGGGGDAAGGREKRRHQRGGRAGTDRGASAAGPSGDGLDRGGRRGGQHGPRVRAEHERRRGDLRRGRTAQRRGVSARRGRAQQRA